METALKGGEVLPSPVIQSMLALGHGVEGFSLEYREPAVDIGEDTDLAVRHVQVRIALYQHAGALQHCEVIEVREPS